MEDAAASPPAPRRRNKRDDILDVARQHLEGGGPLTRVERSVADAAAANRRLLAEVGAGRVLIGEYHAQLALDHIELSDVVERREEQLRALEEREAQLDARLEFLFLESRRLSEDNDRIVEEGRSKDAELLGLYAALEMHKARQRSLQRAVRGSQEEQSAAALRLHKAAEQRRASRAKLVRQHEKLWQLQDVTEALRADIAAMNAMLARGARLQPIDGAEQRQQWDSTRAGPHSSSNSSSGGGGGSGGGVAVVEAGGGFRPLSGATAAPLGDQRVCEREDCVVLRDALQETLAQIRALGARRSDAEGPGSRGSSSPAASTASGVSRPLGFREGGGGSRRKSKTTFLL